MEIILLEKVRNLGDFGAQVKVKPGFGRNYLIPYGKAVPATKANLASFAERRKDLEQAAIAAHKKAEQRAEKLKDLVVTIKARAADEGRLYGSIGVRDVALAISDAAGVEVHKSEVMMPNGVIRQVGELELLLELHADVSTYVKVLVVEDK